VPVVKAPIARHVSVQWLGGDVLRRFRDGTRAALTELGAGAVTVAQEHVHVDTGNLRDNIEARVPRSVAGSARYVLTLGVFPDGPNASAYPGQQPAWQYAFWQETLPEPRGRAFLRPALDYAVAHYEEVFRAKVRFKIGVRKGTLPPGSSGQSYYETDTNIGTDDGEE
jgi:hypothetical protein